MQKLFVESSEEACVLSQLLGCTGFRAPRHPAFSEVNQVRTVVESVHRKVWKINTVSSLWMREDS